MCVVGIVDLFVISVVVMAIINVFCKIGTDFDVIVIGVIVSLFVTIDAVIVVALVVVLVLAVAAVDVSQFLTNPIKNFAKSLEYDAKIKKLKILLSKKSYIKLLKQVCFEHTLFNALLCSALLSRPGCIRLCKVRLGKLGIVCLSMTLSNLS